MSSAEWTLLKKAYKICHIYKKPILILSCKPANKKPHMYSEKYYKLTFYPYCHLPDGNDDDDVLDCGEAASLVEIWSWGSCRVCILFLDGHTFQTFNDSLVLLLLYESEIVLYQLVRQMKNSPEIETMLISGKRTSLLEKINK